MTPIRGISDSDRGGIDTLLKPVPPYYILLRKSTGRYVLLDQLVRNCVNGRPPNNDFATEDDVREFCKYRNLRLSAPPAPTESNAEIRDGYRLPYRDD